ncbi:MAG: hypothetical protein ACJATA_001580 [Sphingobacteriales bacterium]|jgi:hypothetical protein
MNFKSEISNLISGKTSNLTVDDLNTSLSGMTLRDVLLNDFAASGIDIAFSGKGLNEKGVIIDLDDSYLDQLNTEGHPLKMGRTVIVVKQQND